MGSNLCSNREKLSSSHFLFFTTPETIEFTPKRTHICSFDEMSLEASILFGEVEVFKETMIHIREKLVGLSKLDNPCNDGAIIQALKKLSNSYQYVANCKREFTNETVSSSACKPISTKDLQEFDVFLRRYKRLILQGQHLEQIFAKLSKIGINMNETEASLKMQLHESGLGEQEINKAVSKILANQVAFESAFDKAETFYCWYLKERSCCENHRETMEYVLKVYEEEVAPRAINAY